MHWRRFALIFWHEPKSSALVTDCIDKPGLSSSLALGGITVLSTHPVDCSEIIVSLNRSAFPLIVYANNEIATEVAIRMQITHCYLGTNTRLDKYTMIHI